MQAVNSKPLPCCSCKTSTAGSTELWGPCGLLRSPCCCSVSKVKCWWGGRGAVGKCPGQARFAAAFLLWLDSNQGSFASCCCAGQDESFPDSAEWEHHLLKVQHCRETRCREVLACHKEPRSHMSHHGTATASQKLLWSGCTPLQRCLFLFVPSPRGVLGEEWQAALIEGMLGGAGRGAVLPGTCPQKSAVTWERGKRQRAREHWFLLLSNSS